jgi:hypothetical protein
MEWGDMPRYTPHLHLVSRDGEWIFRGDPLRLCTPHERRYATSHMHHEPSSPDLFDTMSL